MAVFQAITQPVQGNRFPHQKRQHVEVTISTLTVPPMTLGPSLAGGVRQGELPADGLALHGSSQNCSVLQPRAFGEIYISRKNIYTV